MDLKYINFKERDGISWVQFNRPEKLNALDPAVLWDLEQAVVTCEEDDAIRVVVFLGNEKAFVAGAEIENMAKGDIKSAFELTDLTMRVQERLADLPKPTIAAISGYAIGGGCEIALCCDLRIAAGNAVFGQPEITLGIIPGGGGGTQRLTRLVSLGPATELIFTGEMIKAEKAERIGLVSKVVALDQLKAEAEALASKLIEGPALALRAAKTAIRRGLNVSLKEGLSIEQDLFCVLFGTEDRKEGMTAFLEKRKPVFKGKWEACMVGEINKVSVVGAGMMGAEIALCFAMLGCEVVMKDATLELAQKGKGRLEGTLDKAVQKGRFQAENEDPTLSRITPTEQYEALKDVDLIVEAVFEDLEIKRGFCAIG